MVWKGLGAPGSVNRMSLFTALRGTHLETKAPHLWLFLARAFFFFFLSGRGGDALVGIIHFVIRGDNNLPTVPLDCK